jgi:hypothetical protein
MIIVLDNASTDDTQEKVTNEFPQVLFIKSEKNSGYAAAINNAFKYSNSNYIIVSNADVIFFEYALHRLTEFLHNNPSVGICGPQQQYFDGSWEYSYGDYPGIKIALKDLFLISSFQRFIRSSFWNHWKIDKNPREVDYIDGAVMAIKREAFNNINGFDEDFFFYTEEADFCYRLKKNGWSVFFHPKANVMHFRGGSSSKIGMNENVIKQLIQSKILFCKKHYSFTYLKIYIFVESLSSKVLSYFWYIIYKIGINKKMSKQKYYMFQLINQAWNKFKNNEK